MYTSQAKRKFVKCATGALAVMLAFVAPYAAAQAAQAYPTKPITLVVPFPPGGSTDILGRILADALSSELKQPVVVENRGGAAGNIGAAAVAQAKGDGYTLLLGYNGTNAINPSLYKKLSWDPIRSFAPVSMLARANNVVVVNASRPFTTLEEVIAFAKAHPSRLNYGTAGPGTIFHLAGAMLEQQAGILMTQVPYKGSGPAMTDLASGQIDLMITTIPAAMPHIQSGRIRPVAATGLTRASVFPRLKTAKESGYENMVVDSWFALFAPESTSPVIINALNDAVRRALEQPRLKGRMSINGLEPIRSSPAELARTLHSDLMTWRALIEKLQITVD